MNTLTFAPATPDRAAELAALKNAAADALTERFGLGHWSGHCTEKGVLFEMRQSPILVAEQGGSIVGTLRMATKKPWAIDVAYFTRVKKPLYLVSMAVHPDHQRKGIGRALVEHARTYARDFPAQAIRLDAYDAPAGAGGFYARCEFRETGRVVYKDVPLIYFEFLI